MVKSVAQDMNPSFSNPGFQAELYKMLLQDEGASYLSFTTVTAVDLK
jgi:hypothetical protein